MQTRAKRHINILAFGDSLTEGMHEERAVFHPYATRLQALLTAHNSSAEVVESGRSGEQVEPSMLLRLADELTGAAPARGMLTLEQRNAVHHGGDGSGGGGSAIPATTAATVAGAAGAAAAGGAALPEGQKGRRLRLWDVVVLLGGINDIWHQRSPKRVFEGLMQMADEVRKSGAAPMVMTLLDISRPATDSLDIARQTVNTLLRQRCRTRLDAAPQAAPGGGTRVVSPHRAALYDCGSGTILVDVEPVLPNKAMAPDERGRIWCSDGLHLRPAGYDRLGEVVFDALLDSHLITL